MPIDDHPLSTEQNAEFKTETPPIDSIETIVKDSNTNRVRNSVKRLAIGFTIAYIILFVPFFYMGLFSSMTFDNPRMTVPVGLSIMFFIFLIPFSMPVSIYLMMNTLKSVGNMRTRLSYDFKISNDSINYKFVFLKFRSCHIFCIMFDLFNGV